MSEQSCPRYIFVTGGVVSSLGKGVAAASIACLLQARGYKTRLKKLDPYLNIDPGTMNPYEHGEVYVTNDGAECDLDLGHYERLTGQTACREDNITTGQLYHALIQKERRGDFLGATIQVIPHVTNAIKTFITANNEGYDFILVELGGTVGDIEGLPFFESIRQLVLEFDPRQSVVVHLTLVPYLKSSGELKTKPSQHSVKLLQSIGIQPNILLCRCEHPLPQEARRKLALFSNIHPDSVIEALDVPSFYEVPLKFFQHRLDREILKYFHMPIGDDPTLSQWKTIVKVIHQPKHIVNIAIVGKYVNYKDAYKSVVEALNHGGFANEAKVELVWIDAEEKQSKLLESLAQCHAIVVPGGFGLRGIQGKLCAIRYAREHKIPFLGICLGMQLAVIEAARSLANLEDADSTEFGPTKNPVVGLMREWKRDATTETRDDDSDKGGTMRLGSYTTHLRPGSKIAEIYGSEHISERHRHRYEVNAHYLQQLEAVGLHFSGFSPDGQLPETVEFEGHPWFIAVQFHPEFNSQPFAPHPLFESLVRHALETKKIKTKVKRDL